MSEKYYVVYLTSGNTARIKADDCYVGAGEYVFEKNDKVVARFSCVTVEGWVQEDSGHAGHKIVFRRICGWIQARKERRTE